MFSVPRGRRDHSLLIRPPNNDCIEHSSANCLGTDIKIVNTAVFSALRSVAYRDFGSFITSFPKTIWTPERPAPQYVLGGVPLTADAEDAFVIAVHVPTTITLVSGRVQKYTSSRRYCQISSSFSTGAGRRKNVWRFPVFPKTRDVFKNTHLRRVHITCAYTRRSQWP